MTENIAFVKHKQDAIKTQRDYSENKRNSWKLDSRNKTFNKWAGT